MRWYFLLMISGLIFGCAHTPDPLPVVTGDIAFVAGEPLPFYRDPDPAARATPWGDPVARSIRLKRLLSTDPRNIGAHLELAYLHSVRGDRVAMDGHYLRAKRLAKDDTRWMRRILWSEGWSCLNLGDASCAITSWKISTLMHGGAPFWQPYSYAVALWSAGRHDDAVRWYRAAVASDPDGWRSEPAMLARTRHWRSREQELMKEVFAAHAARPAP